MSTCITNFSHQVKEGDNAWKITGKYLEDPAQVEMAQGESKDSYELIFPDDVAVGEYKETGWREKTETYHLSFVRNVEPLSSFSYQNYITQPDNYDDPTPPDDYVDYNFKGTYDDKEYIVTIRLMSNAPTRVMLFEGNTRFNEIFVGRARPLDVLRFMGTDGSQAAQDIIAELSIGQNRLDKV